MIHPGTKRIYEDLILYLEEDYPITYLGEAPPGTATSDAKWRIKKIDETTDTTITYAGTGAFDQVWDNRLSLLYN